jgi:hypothetical protein
MKQSAVKTLGVAALGVAFAAAGAGAANAAPALPDAAGALGSVGSVVPVEQATSALPAGTPQAVGAAQNAVTTGVAAAQPAVAKITQGGDPVSGLLGGLPTQGLPLG